MAFFDEEVTSEEQFNEKSPEFQEELVSIVTEFETEHADLTPVKEQVWAFLSKEVG